MVSIRKNIVFNIIKTICTILFPIISYSYASRVIGIANIGKVNYSLSIVNYFVLIASLGITTYGIREGAKVRDDREKISNLVSELFSINIISTIVSYALLIILIVLLRKLHPYLKLIIIQSLLIFGTTLGVEWAYNIFEDFKYMAVRSILVQIISLFGLLLFVHNENDVVLYTFILTLSKTGSYLFGFLYIKRYVVIRFTLSGKLLRHLKPIFVLLGLNIAQTIYTNSDITMIGIYNSDINVGIYTAAVNVYLGVKSIIYAIINVFSPRIAYERKLDDREAVTRRRYQLYQVLALLVLPTCMGLIFVSKDIIVAYGSKKSYESYIPLQILSIALFFSAFAGYKSSSFLIIENREKSVLRAMSISAILNVILNFWFIPHYKQNGAAITTLISEFTMWLLNTISIRDLYNERPTISLYRDMFLGAACVAICCVLCRLIIGNIWIRLALSVAVSIITYSLLLYTTGNGLIRTGFQSLCKQKQGKDY